MHLLGKFVLRWSVCEYSDRPVLTGIRGVERVWGNEDIHLVLSDDIQFLISAIFRFALEIAGINTGKVHEPCTGVYWK
jgi:hypothetical protein